MIAAGREERRRPRRKPLLTEVLPPGMIAELQSLGTALLTVVREHRDAPLAALEGEVLETVRAKLPKLLEEVVKLSTTSLQPTLSHWQQPCPNCGQYAQVQSWRPRTLTTVCGRITFERPWFVCRDCQHGFSPVDRTLGLQARSRLSEGLREWIVGLGASTSFAEAAYWLEKLTGLAVSPETVRQQTEQRGHEMEVAQQQASEQVKETQEPATPLDAAPGVLVVETDGVMLRYLDGWHEVKLGLVAGHQDGEMVAPSYIAARMSAETFGLRLLAESARRGALEVVAWEGSSVRQPGLAVLREVVVLGDGAPWIWNLAAEHFGERIEIVDFYHASEHAWKVAKALYGEGTVEARTWAIECIEELLKKGAGPVQKALAVVTAPGNEVAEEVLRVERGYFRTNAARMDYPKFRELGLPIGSGAVESSAKHLVQQRMKRPGARWSDPGAQAVLNVRSHLLSGLPLAS